MTREEAINKLEHLIISPVGREEINETCYEVMKYLSAQEPRVMAGAELTDTELIEEIRKAPFVLKPNVDAIPVEWLKKVRKDASEGDSLDVGIAEVLDMWEKEQEAR